MNELQEMVNNRIAEMFEEGTITELVNARAEEAIKDILNTSFEPYGELYKTLKDKIEDSIESSFWNFKLEPYTDVMNKFAQEKIVEYLHDEAKNQIATSLDRMFKPLPKSITMQELVTSISEEWKTDDDCYCGDNDEHLSMKCTQRDTSNFYTIKFWKKKYYSSYYASERKENDPDIEIHLTSNGEICWLSDSKRDYGAHNYNVEAWIYRMTIARTPISDIRECDQDEFENTYIGPGEDY